MGLFFTYLGAVNQGLIWGFLALGVYITFRVLDIADLTVDGSFTTGGAVCAISLLNDIHPLIALLFAIIAGFIAGAITGILHTKCKIPAILAGILTQIGAEVDLDLSSNGTNRVSLIKALLTLRFQDISIALDVNRYYVTLVIALIFTVIFIIMLYVFFGTEMGSAIRATGNNEQMARSLGISTDNMKLLGLMISNGLVGLSGALYTLYGQAIDVRAGTGAIVIALASIVIGEVLFSGKRTGFAVRLTSVVIGSIIYRIIVAVVLQMGLNTDDLKLLTAIIVAIALSVPTLISNQRQVAMYKKLTGKEKNDA